jgi:hypothetical protein
MSPISLRRQFPLPDEAVKTQGGLDLAPVFHYHASWSAFNSPQMQSYVYMLSSEE